MTEKKIYRTYMILYKREDNTELLKKFSTATEEQINEEVAKLTAEDGINYYAVSTGAKENLDWFADRIYY